MTTSTHSESVYQKLVDHMHEGIWSCDQKDYILYANPAFCKISGYSLQELNTMTEFDLWDRETGAMIRKINTSERKEGLSSSYEATLITKSGNPVHLLVTGIPLGNGNTMGIFSDMTEMKRQKLLYRNLVLNMSEGVWMGDATGKTIYANPKFRDLIGYKLEDIESQEFTDFFSSKNYSTIKKMNSQKYTGKGKNLSFEAHLKTNSTDVIPVLISAQPLPYGGNIAIITDLRQIKEKEQTEQILTNAFAHTQDAMIIFNSQAQILRWNKGAKIIFGYNKKEMEEKSMNVLFSTEEIQHLFQSSQIQKNLELRAQHKNGTPLVISATLTPLNAPRTKTATSFLLLARNITNQLKFEEELSLKYQKTIAAYNQFGIVRRQMDYIFDLLEFARADHKIETVCSFIVSAIAMLSRADACTVRLYNRKNDSMELKAVFGAHPNWWGHAVVPFSGSMVEQAFYSKRPLKIVDLANEPRYHSAQLARSQGFSSVLLIALEFYGNFLGYLAIYVTSEKKLEVLENEFLEKYAQVVEVVLGNMQKEHS